MSRILIVDDERSIRVTLRSILDHAGYEAEVAEDAAQAQRMLDQAPFDVVLSDIVLPRVSGVALLEAIRKAAPQVQVVMMTGEPTVETAAAAVRAGAADYLTKPVDKETVLKAVRNAARVKLLEDERRRLEAENEAYRRELEEQNAHLDALVRERSRQLAEAHDRLALADRTKADFLRLLSHELRTPAHGILGVAEMVFDSCPDQQEVRELRGLFDLSRNRMLETLDGALLLARIQTSKEAFQPTRVSLGEVLSGARAAALARGRAHGVAIGSLPARSATVLGDPELFLTAFSSLMETAVLFTEKGGTVRIGCAETPGAVTLRLMGRGKSPAPETVAEFFEVFTTVSQSSPAEKLGLKPAVAARILSLFGGHVQIASADPPGVELTIKMPTIEGK